MEKRKEDAEPFSFASTTSRRFPPHEKSFGAATSNDNSKFDGNGFFKLLNLMAWPFTAIEFPSASGVLATTAFSPFTKLQLQLVGDLPTAVLEKSSKK